MLRSLTLLLAPLAALLWPPTLQARGLPLGVPLTARGYTRVLTKRGVTVYRNKRSTIIDIAAEGRLPVSPEQLQRTLVSYERHRGRIARVAESRVLQRKPGHLLVYQRLDLPWISDRDFTLAVRWGADGTTRWVDFHVARSRGPRPRDGVVRLAHHVGSWELRPARQGGTFARYQLALDLAGSLPRWLARGSAGKEVPKLFGALCRMAVSGKARSRCP